MKDANHNPEVTVNGVAGKAPLAVKATIGEPLILDAAGTRDPNRILLISYPPAAIPVFCQRFVTGRAHEAAALRTPRTRS